RNAVIVNGSVVLENARHTDATPGLVLRRAADGGVS
ncbi:MAG: hypothetical protein K0R53_66, partial [Burkholderiales bacterium]|nr:hypothetical protein [Burkholderiales bacterium]